MPAYERREFSAVAPEVDLVGDITNVSTSISVTDGTGYPTGATGPFFINIEAEDILAQSRTANTFDVTGGRGMNGTSAAAHVDGTHVNHVHVTRDDDEANLAVVKTIGKATAVGQILISDAANSFTGLSVKDNAKILIGNGTTAAMQAVSGDVTLTNAGVVTLVATAVLNIVEPIGSMKLQAAATYDTARYLACDGAAVSRATYATLYTALGGAASPWGQGNGTTTFNTPNVAGRAIMGSGAGSGLTSRAIAAVVGAETHTLAAVESGIASHNHTSTDAGHTHTTPNHTHTVTISDHNHSAGAPNTTFVGQGGGDGGWTDGFDTVVGKNVITTANAALIPSVGNASPTTNTGTASLSVGSATATAAANAHNNMQPSIAVPVIIRYA
jgi:microcystin-dependent protein